MEFLKNNQNVAAALLIGLGLVVSASVVSGGIIAMKKLDNTLQVTGSAKKAVTADSAKWNGNFSRTVGVEGLKEGYAQMAVDEKAVAAFFKKNGLGEKDVTIQPVFLATNYRYPENAISGYTLTQNVQVQTADLALVETLARKTADLINQGVTYSAFNIEYYYSKLPELRVSLLGEAVKDAKKRAGEIAGSNGQSVDSLKSASTGVVQVLAPNSIDVSDYGSYDTSSKEKEVMVTVRTTFGLN